MSSFFEKRLHGLRWRLRAMRRLWSPGMRPHMPFLRGEGLADLGAIDEPLAGETVGEEPLLVRGWAVFASGPATRVEAWLGERPLGRARLGFPRPDVVKAADLPKAAAAGFELRVDLGPEPQAGELRVLATCRHGETLELGPVPLAAAAEPKDEAERRRLPIPAAGERKGSASRTLVVTHQLNLGGAQLYLMDLLKGLREREAIEPVVLSGADGLLRDELEAWSIPVHVTNLAPGDSLAAHEGRVEEIAAWAEPYGFELALVNTATSVVVPAADALARLGVPTVWAIHESFGRAILWADMPAPVRERAAAVLGDAAAAVFEAEATQELYAGLIDPARSQTLPYGLDFDPIDAARAKIDVAARRRAEEISEKARLIVCVGTVEPRKGQIPLAQAFGEIGGRHPEAQLAFVGGRALDPYTAALEEVIEDSPHGDQMRVVPVTPDVDAWYAMADLLVCASDVESLPRTVIEAMAWETPVLATSVFGLPELIEDGVTGWLCEPGDTVELAAALDRVLYTPPAELRQVAGRARALVERRHSLPAYAQEISRLLGEVAAGADKRDRRIPSQ